MEYESERVPELKADPNRYSSEGSVSWQQYERIRPRYPQKLYDIILTYLGQHNDTDKKLCVDYGSGSCVIAPAILESLGVHKVLATDRNARQLDEGKIKLEPIYGEERLQTMVGAAGELHMISSDSVDLVTAAECAHYFDRPKWLKEVARILKPSGTLAIWHYQPQCFIISHPEAALACNRAFERFFQISVPRGAFPIEMVIYSMSQLDSVVLDPALFHQQERYKWLLPKAISNRIVKDAETGINDTAFTEDQARAGLLAAPNSMVIVSEPNVVDEMPLHVKNWTTKTIMQYMETMGEPSDKLLSDEIFGQCIQEIEALVGGPQGTFDVGWTFALLLATRSEN